VRFSQARVAVVHAPCDDPSDPSADARITGAAVMAALEEDGVDVARWRARVALAHPGATTALAQAPRLHPDASASGASSSSSSGHDSAIARGASPAFATQPFVGWRRLENRDEIAFARDAVGLLVQLEDALVATTASDEDVARSEALRERSRRGGGGRRGAKARARRSAAQNQNQNQNREDSAAFREEEDDSSDDARSGAPASGAYVAANYWRLGDEDAPGASRSGGNNPYAGADSRGATILRPASDARGDDVSPGYFGVGVVKPKHEENVGTLWRSAWQMGADFIFTVSARFKYEASDTTQAHKRLPMYAHEDWASFARSAPRGAVWVAIEMGGVPLQDFAHPPRAVYVLGSEDNGLNRPIVEACQCHVALPHWMGRSASYNVAMAGTMVMYDRMLKRLRAGAAVAEKPRRADPE
jgi:tRNA(Leu) C34 or U34 (ribose-2'-O)-methylase TrmL